MFSLAFASLWALPMAGCGCDPAPDSEIVYDASTQDRATLDANQSDGSQGEIRDASAIPDSAQTQPDAMVTQEPCRTRITYGSGWFRPDGHQGYDVADGRVTWDGACPVDASGNGYATLSNGWKPFFRGRSCSIALDYSGACENVPTRCGTRIAYGPSWLRADNHPANHDDVGGVVTTSGQCYASGGNSYVELSNGWRPHFSGSQGCDVALRHEQCGGLFVNPVLGENCPDPGVLKDGDTYVMTCTNGSRGVFPIWTSKTLTSWSYVGTAFRTIGNPSWGERHFWAPEIHKVGDKYVIYFSAWAKGGTFAIGAGTSDSPTGPFTDLGKPLLTAPHPGVIDAHYFRRSNGEHYLLWKIDGNAVGQSTPIRIQPLAADGLSLTGSPTTILSNTLAWEGGLVEGAFMIEEGNYFYLFYSGNGYGSTRYGVSVARSTSPLGPFSKLGDKLLGSNAAWSGPGHGSIVRGTDGGWVHVYHSWVAGQVNGGPGRVVLVDRVQGGWPRLRASPSFRSQPLP